MLKKNPWVERYAKDFALSNFILTSKKAYNYSDFPFSTVSISMVPGLVLFFRFSSGGIPENPAVEKNSHKYLTNFIKELVSIFESQSNITKFIGETFKSYKEKALENSKKAVKQKKLEKKTFKLVKISIWQCKWAKKS